MFIRRTVEQMVMKMIIWGRGSSKQLTDFRPGSKTRTIFEAVAIVVEDFYDKLYRSIRVLIEENIYAIFGFDKIASVHATGLVSFARATIADRDYTILVGTLVQTAPTGGKQAMNYRTTQEAVLKMGTLSVEVNVVCEMAGELGNTGADTVNVLPTSINGVDYITNLKAFTNGQEEETKEAQKARFQRFIEANARAVLPSIEYGATLGNVINEEGIIVERVIQAKAFEDLPARIGEVDVYLWNGVDGASEALLKDAHKHITGYYDSSGNRIYGYKSAGIWLNMYVASLKRVKAKAVIVTENWFPPTEAEILAEREIDLYFADLVMGETLVQTALEANIKNISGIYDVKLYLSTDDGVSYNTENVEADGKSIILIDKPITFETTSLPSDISGETPETPFPSTEDPPLGP